jgi:catechol 2,3-dioxygenase-like lactoylglutathione lyase family enzyme
MTVLRMDHVNIRTAKFEESIAFYRDILGLEAGPTPGGDRSRAAWMYDSGGHPVIHVGRPEMTYPGDRLAGLTNLGGEGTGSIDHVALECTGLDEYCARVDAAGYPHERNTVDSISLEQLFVRDPNGVLFELNFR